MGDNDLADLNIGTNGKGLTARYALASAYGEFMERLQNNLLIMAHKVFATKEYLATAPEKNGFHERLERENLFLDFLYGPDEVYLDINFLMGDCSDVLGTMFLIDDKDTLRDYLHKVSTVFNQNDFGCLPYYSVFQNQVRLLPIKLILNSCGSNGMCAGNTPEEALIQGISEIFERFVIRSIYNQKITPPTISTEYFKNTTILDRIQRLEKKGMTVIIKDCSLGLGLPVIGLLLTYQTTEKDAIIEKYTFHVGADPCPITALERCLTEIYQGNPQEIECRFHPKKARNILVEGYNDDEEQPDFALQVAYHNTIENGSGYWPDCIFSDKATYTFTGFAHPVSLSDTTDLAYLVNKVKNLGKNIFIRDVSFFGFPSYQIYIPGMTEVNFIEKIKDFPSFENLGRNHLTLLNLRKADTEDIIQLTKAIKKTAGVPQQFTFKPKDYFLNNVHPALQNMSRDYLLALLYSRISDYQAAAESMDIFLQSKVAQEGPLLYYQVIHSYLKAKSSKLTDAQIKTMLTESYDEEVVRNVLEWFNTPERIFEQVILPSCFDCSNCKIEGFCRYFALIRKVKTFQSIQKANVPDQARLAKIFST